MTITIIPKRAVKLLLYLLLFVPVLSVAALILNHLPDPKKILSDHVQPVAKEKQVATISGKPAYFHLPVWMQSGSVFPAVDTVPFTIIKKDRNNVTRYFITGTLFKSDRVISLSLSDSLLLNYKKWNVSPGNRISYTPEGISVSGFLLSNDSAKITLVNRQNLTGTPIDISIRNFDVKDITGIFNMDTLAASGLMNADIQVNGFGKMLSAFTGTASVNNLQLMGRPLGSLQLNGQMVRKNTIHATLELTGNGNDISAAGNFFLNNSTRQLDAVLNIRKAQLSVLADVLKSSISAASGSLNGLLSLKGKFKEPAWSGALNFDSVKFTLNQLGTTYSIDKQKISFDYPAISFNSFIIKDSLDHSLIINGKLHSKSISLYDIAVDLSSRDFSLINAPKAINNQLYGYSGVDAKLAITGNTLKPVIAGDIHFNGKTDVTMVLPEKNADKDAAGSVIRFIKRDTFSFAEKESFKKAVVQAPDIKRFLNNKLNFHADGQAVLTIVIDPSTGDVLKVKGVTQFNTGIGAGAGKIMSGIYHLDSGYYELNYQFSKKRFNLIPGSTIEFNGDPADAKINIRAEYIANTVPKDLLGNEVGVVSPGIARSFNRELPFRVILSLKGSLNKPAISFDIQLPEEKGISRQLRTTIENKLAQLRADVAATNKEVFALLALGRFVGEQSTDFFKGNGADFSDINKESVSQFLSAALDRLASDLFKGINIDLNLNSYKDFTTNDGTQKSDLNVEVSKNFLDDRLTVTVGKNFGIETQDASTKASQQKASRFLPDVTVNYKLSGDGKYMIRGYNKNPFEVVMDGYVVETGLAFIITMDYEKYEELFIKKDKK